jgi:hypothetical protein
LLQGGLADLERLVGPQLLKDEPPGRRAKPVAGVAGMVDQGGGRVEPLLAAPEAAGEQREASWPVGLQQLLVDPEDRLTRDPLGQRPGKPVLPVRLGDRLSGSKLFQVAAKQAPQGRLADRPAGSCPPDPGMRPIHGGSHYRVPLGAGRPAGLIGRDQLTGGALVLEEGREPSGFLRALFELLSQLGGQPIIRPVVWRAGHRRKHPSLPVRSVRLVVTAQFIIERHYHRSR